MASTVSATVATFSGEQLKDGPAADYRIGVASDKQLKINFSVPEKEGLNISLPERSSFDPENAGSRISVGNEQLPLQEFYLQIDSINPQKNVYSIPVRIEMWPEVETGEGTRPQVVQEREYVYEFNTVIEDSGGLDEGLISDPGEDSESEDADPVNISTGDAEDSLTEENNSGTDEPQNPENDQINRMTWILIGLIVVISSYIVVNLL